MSEEVKGHFLSDKQKQVKQEIMEGLMDAFYGSIDKHSNLFVHDPQSVLDMGFSVSMMFTRDIIVHLLQMSGCQHKRKDIMKNFCEHLRNEVDHKIKASLI